VYAIVDIETTGGYASAGGITEIAIVIYDGEKIVDRYETLVNPIYTIPRYVQALTGITNEMVEQAPAFDTIAPKIYELLSNKVFIAHNVNFDYSFIKYHLDACGFDLNVKKLCTVRLARKLLPNLPSYSLGNLCRSLEIPIYNRHRAGGDADATAILFGKLLKQDAKGEILLMLKGRNKEQYLPPNLPVEQIKNLPQKPGVYYFHDQKGKVIYVGKAKSIYKRVSSHFANNTATKQKQEFLRNIYHVSYQALATELMAFIYESLEIKKHWPVYNRSQKRFEHTYALYTFEDRKGYLRLAIEKKNRTMPPLYTFNLLVEGHHLLRKLMSQFQLCPKLCHLQATQQDCTADATHHCKGACREEESADIYNTRVMEAISHLEKELPTFALVEHGLHHKEQSCVFVEKGKFYGMGYIPSTADIRDRDALKDHLTQYSENDYIRGLIYQYANRYPSKRVNL
jgi:DNA polymerase III subunit epsilon